MSLTASSADSLPKSSKKQTFALVDVQLDLAEVERKYSHCNECFRIGSIPASDSPILERTLIFARAVSAYGKGVLKLQKKYEKYIENIYQNEKVKWSEGGIVQDFVGKAKEIKRFIK